MGFNLGNLSGLNISFQKSQMMKDIGGFLDKNLKSNNLYLGLRDTSQGIIDTVFENKLIQNISGGLGGVFSTLGGFGKALFSPNIDFPSISFGGIGGAVGDFISDVGGAINDVGGVLGDVASYVMPSIGISGNLGGVLGGSMPNMSLGNPFNSQRTDYGGEAVFKNRAGLRSPSGFTYPNEPTPVERSVNRRLSNATQQPSKDRSLDQQTVSTPYSHIGLEKYSQENTSFYPGTSINEKGGGDRMTLAPMLKGRNLTAAGYIGRGLNVESDTEGMPVYFKDLRDNTYIIFRGYIEALTENVSPTWSSVNYIGRSEPVFVYEKGERDFSFTLKLFAQTAQELDAIYAKMRRLTSLAYPEYQVDKQFSGAASRETSHLTRQREIDADVNKGKRRMKPPLLSFRIGELFGNNNRNQLGFLKSLNYSWPDMAPWEWREGQRVPKYVVANIGLQVLHEVTPNKNTLFYGYETSNRV